MQVAAQWLLPLREYRVIGKSAPDTGGGADSVEFSYVLAAGTKAFKPRTFHVLSESSRNIEGAFAVPRQARGSDGPAILFGESAEAGANGF